jgi:hypothetical protein
MTAVNDDGNIFNLPARRVAGSYMHHCQLAMSLPPPLPPASACADIRSASISRPSPIWRASARVSTASPSEAGRGLYSRTVGMKMWSSRRGGCMRRRTSKLAVSPRPPRRHWDVAITGAKWGRPDCTLRAATPSPSTDCRLLGTLPWQMQVSTSRWQGMRPLACLTSPSLAGALAVRVSMEP